MFGQLLESRARRARRTGGAALSVAMHTAIIGAATALTAHGVPAPRTSEAPVPVVFARPAKAVVVDRTPATPAATHAPALPSLHIVVVPTVPPVGLPTIEASSVGPLDSILIVAPGSSSKGGTRIGSVIDPGGSDVPSDGAWTGTELLMRIVASAKPRYPESLRQAGVSGRVLVRFTVDTAGRIDMGTVQVLQSTHDIFSQSVRDVLPRFRFKPSEVNGRRVHSLAEMPFEFQVAR